MIDLSKLKSTYSLIQSLQTMEANNLIRFITLYSVADHFRYSPQSIVTLHRYPATGCGLRHTKFNFIESKYSYSEYDMKYETKSAVEQF